MSMPAESSSQEGFPGIEDVLTALSGADTLGLLGMTTDVLQQVRTDSTLFETMRIIHELFLTLRDEGVLDIFLLLPEGEQANFVGWIGAMDEEGLRHDRTATFISALKQSPLAEGAR